MTPEEREVFGLLLKFAEEAELTSDEYGCGLTPEQFEVEYPLLAQARRDHDALIERAKRILDG